MFQKALRIGLEEDPTRLDDESVGSLRARTTEHALRHNGYAAASFCGAIVAEALPITLDEPIEDVANRIAEQIEFPYAAANIVHSYEHRLERA